MRRLMMACLLTAPTLSAVRFAAAQSADVAPSAEKSDAEERTERARRHFQNGIKLYRDGNYGGALAEFEAAYELKPGPSSLQNVALSLKGLFRYAEGADTLALLLERHAAELEEAERQAVRTALEELSSLVGSIVIGVEPSTARVSINGNALEPSELGKPIRLNVGEHQIAAEALGYARAKRTIRVAGGQSNVPVQLSLRPTLGFISVVTDDPKAAIAIGGKSVAYHRYSGALTPGEHLLQVYKPGYEQFKELVNIELGKTTHIAASLGPPLDEGDEETSTTPGTPTAQVRGWYGLLTLSIVTLDDAPQKFNIDEVDSRAGGSIGLRAGYRLWTPVAVELMLDAGKHDIRDACFDEACTEKRDFTLESARVGGNVRYMSGGRKLRFSSTLGIGAVRHKLDIKASPAEPEVQAAGVDPYFMAEVGAQYNWGQLLLELDLVAFIDGASSGDIGDHYGSGLPMIGLGLRGGWSEWKP